jgi:hypothetical protein
MLVCVLVGITCYRRYKQGKIMSVFITIFAIIAAVYIGLSVLLFLMQSRILYQPMRGYDYTPADYGLDYEKVSLSAPAIPPPITDWTMKKFRCRRRTG